MPRFSFPDVLRAWIDPDVLGLTALPLPAHLVGCVGCCDVCGASRHGADSPFVATPRCELPAGIDALISLGDYGGPAGQAARLIKGTGWTDGAWWWGSALGTRLATWSTGGGGASEGAVQGGRAATMSTEVVLVPVPGDRWRTLYRGIDHATALTRAASASSGWPWRSLLVRQDRTRQASRGAQKRRASQGRFRIESKYKSFPKRVVLVDDVCTTGATGADCARAIRRAGARWVALGVLARAH